MEKQREERFFILNSSFFIESTIFAQNFNTSWL